MSEQLKISETPEQRVFGEAFSLETYAADEETVDRVKKEKYERLANGEQVWIPMTLDADSGVVAELFKNHVLVASVDYRYIPRNAVLYTYLNNCGGRIVQERIPFDEAVVAAEALADQLNL
jgi:hypothetical protein